MSITFRCETEADHYAVENLTREAFWNVYRPGCTEHYVLHKYRSSSDFIPGLDIVMEIDGRLIGHIMYVRSEIATGSGALPIVTFGPVSVAPEFNRRGYGKNSSTTRSPRLKSSPERSRSPEISPSTASAALCTAARKESATPSPSPTTALFPTFL